MAETLYLLCTATALGCCVLLLRGYRGSRVELLFWSGLCFGALALENLLLFFDRIVFPTPDVDLSWWRLGVSLAGVVLLLYGLIWKSDK